MENKIAVWMQSQIWSKLTFFLYPFQSNLFVAALSRCLQWLVEHGADTTTPDLNGNTPQQLLGAGDHSDVAYGLMDLWGGSELPPFPNSRSQLKGSYCNWQGCDSDGWCLMFKKKLQTLDFQVLVYQAPPQSARFLGTFHNVLTCAYKTGPQWWTSWDDPLWRKSRCSLLLSQKNFALAFEGLHQTWKLMWTVCAFFPTQWTLVFHWIIEDWCMMMYGYPIRKLQKSAKVCRTKRFPHFNSQKKRAQNQSVKSAWKHRESEWKTRDFRVTLIREKTLFFDANRSTSVRCSPVYIYIPHYIILLQCG